MSGPSQSSLRSAVSRVGVKSSRQSHSNKLDARHGVGESLAQVKVGMKVKMSDNTDMLAAPYRFLYDWCKGSASKLL